MFVRTSHPPSPVRTSHSPPTVYTNHLQLPVPTGYSWSAVHACNLPSTHPHPIPTNQLADLQGIPPLIFSELPDDGILNDVLGSMEQPNLRSMIYKLEKEIEGIKQWLVDLENSAPPACEKVNGTSESAAIQLILEWGGKSPKKLLVFICLGCKH